MTTENLIGLHSAFGLALFTWEGFEGCTAEDFFHRVEMPRDGKNGLIASAGDHKKKTQAMIVSSYRVPEDYLRGYYGGNAWYVKILLDNKLYFAMVRVEKEPAKT